MENNTLKSITEDEFLERFTMVENHIESNRSFNGCMFETFDAELLYVFELSRLENRVWTILDTHTDNENSCNMVLTTGFHMINRLGFIITKEPYTEDMEVILD